jgi:hypothetical protein
MTMYKFRITDKDGKFIGVQIANSDIHALCVAKINGLVNAYRAEMEGFNW